MQSENNECHKDRKERQENDVQQANLILVV